MKKVFIAQFSLLLSFLPALINQSCRHLKEERTSLEPQPDSSDVTGLEKNYDGNERLQAIVKMEAEGGNDRDQIKVLEVVSDTPSTKKLSTVLVFHTGFEPYSAIINQKSQDARFSGSDLTKKYRKHWKYDLEDHPKIGYVNIQYQGGNSTQRMAEITSDPSDESNKVLKFWIREPNLRNEAGRVQANIYENTGIKVLDYSVRLYLPKDLESAAGAPFRIKWLTLMEFWNNANWTDEPYPFRITVNLQKWSKEYDSLKIGIKSQIRDLAESRWQEPHVWEYINHDFSMPLGKWMDINLYFQEGNTENGRFILIVTPEGEAPVVVHDIHDFTHHPDDPAPDGLSHFNPLKLYTSRKLIEQVNRDDHLLHVYWDDFRLRIGKDD